MTQKSYFSNHWYRVADFKPRLRSHITKSRQVFRGQAFHILQDRQSDKFHKLNPAANHIVALMNGQRTVNEIWERAVQWAPTPEEIPTQDDVVQLLSKLHNADLLVGSVLPDIDELVHRSAKRSRKKLIAQAVNPLGVRVPLIDPDRFLTATRWLVAPIFTFFGLFLWSLLIASALVLAALNWERLTDNAYDRLFLAESMLVFLLVYPVIKTIHELAHGYAVKTTGGEVHEMGLMFLVLFPVPYVDASAASAIPHKWRRALVAASGIMAELLLAAIAMIVWVLAEPGLVRAVAFNVALIASVSTLLFNGNPLLRFDAYYVMSDLIEIPNLGHRANRFVIDGFKQTALGLKRVDEPPADRTEALWLASYAIAAYCYRVLITLTIALFIAEQYFVLGVMLAIWAIGLSLIWPLVKAFWWLVSSSDLRNRRMRALSAVAACIATLSLVVGGWPLPNHTIVPGVVFSEPGATVRAETSGTIFDQHSPDGTHVVSGTPLIQLADPDRIARQAVLSAQHQEISIRRDQAHGQNSSVQFSILTEQMRHATAAAALNADHIEAQTVRAPQDGTMWLANANDLIGRYVQRGDLLGYVLQQEDFYLTVAVSQEDIELILDDTLSIEVVLSTDAQHRFASSVLRAVPKAQLLVPTPLTKYAGGDLPSTVKTAQDGFSEALDPVFLIDLSLSNAPDTPILGARAYARFSHSASPLGLRILRAVRQIFLRQLNV